MYMTAAAATVIVVQKTPEMIEMGTLIKSSRKPLCPLYKSIFHRQPAASRRLTGITIKLQRFHGFTPAAIKNTPKSIFQMN